MRPPFERLLAAYRDKSDRLAYSFFNGKVMDSLKERNMADEYIYFDVESFHQFLEFIIGTVSFKITLRNMFPRKNIVFFNKNLNRHKPEHHIHYQKLAQSPSRQIRCSAMRCPYLMFVAHVQFNMIS